MIRRLLISFVTVSVLLFSVSPSVAAIDPTGGACAGKAASSPVCQEGSDNPISGSNGIILKAVQLVLIAAGVISVLMIMLGGWAYVTSQGDPQKLKGAKDTILYAIIGLVIAGSAQAIISFVFKKI